MSAYLYSWKFRKVYLTMSTKFLAPKSDTALQKASGIVPYLVLKKIHQEAEPTDIFPIG